MRAILRAVVAVTGSCGMLFGPPCALGGCGSERDGGGTGGTAGSTSGVAGSQAGSPAAAGALSGGNAGVGTSGSSGTHTSGGGMIGAGAAAGAGGQGGGGSDGFGGRASGGVAGQVSTTGGMAGTQTTVGGAGASAGGGGTSGAGAGGAGAGGSSAGASATSTKDATIKPDPGWACGMKDGIPAPTKGKLAFTITLNISAEHDVGKTQYGQRRLLDVSGGTIAGDKLQGTVVTGGLEYELTLDNGVMEYQSINVLETSAGRIFVRSCGVAHDKDDAGARIIPDFEATTSGGNAFLNTGKWVATREVTAGKMKLDVYDMAGVTPGDPVVTLAKPMGVPAQPWECNMTKGSQGSTVFTENVSLGSSYGINNAKYGSRNIIPITGGTTTGKVAGKILNGGADYQLSGSLDAWYTLAPDNGEFILVRNCGATGGLIPWFEAKVGGAYDFLNTQAYLSSAPGVGGGGVSITFYDRK